MVQENSILRLLFFRSSFSRGPHQLQVHPRSSPHLGVPAASAGSRNSATRRKRCTRDQLEELSASRICRARHMQTQKTAQGEEGVGPGFWCILSRHNLCTRDHLEELSASRYLAGVHHRPRPGRDGGVSGQVPLHQGPVEELSAFNVCRGNHRPRAGRARRGKGVSGGLGQVSGA